MAARVGYDWRAQMTPEEANSVKELEARLAEADATARKIRGDLIPIRARCIKRAAREVQA